MPKTSCQVALLSCASLLLFLCACEATDDDLKLEHLSVVFRHGDRTPELYPQRFPNDPYMWNSSTFPMSPGGLTNEGKMRMYRFGEMLRERYNDYLGPYDEKRLFAVSSGLSRTKMSLELVLASLYKPSLNPKSVWNDRLDWQPIPTQYFKFKDDKIFNGDMCQIFIDEFRRVYHSPEVQSEIHEYAAFMETVQLLSGKKSPINANDIILLHNNLDIEHRLNLPQLPWMKSLLEDPQLRNFRVLTYRIRGRNTFLRRLSAGNMLRLIRDDVRNARNKTPGYEKKVALYSGHDINVINILNALNLYDSQLPDFSSALIFELLSGSNGERFVKISYFLGIPAETQVLTIPGCAALCPVDDFLALIANVTVSDEERDCKILADSYFPLLD